MYYYCCQYFLSRTPYYVTVAGCTLAICGRLLCDDASYSRSKENSSRTGKKKNKKEKSNKDAPEHPPDFSILRPL